MRWILMTTLLAGTLWGQAPATPAPAPAPAAVPQPVVDAMTKRLADWPQLSVYRNADTTLPAPTAGEKRVIFYGDSITEAWARLREQSFPGKPYIWRGISGQTTPQMLVRFQQDVVHLKPAVVVILAGTNDIAGNTGPSTPEMIQDNFESMIAIAKANNIKVVISSILPADHYGWKSEMHPAEPIRQMNERLKELSKREGLVYVDYYAAMANANGGLDPALSKDGVHPTPQGYAIMSPLAEKAIAEALAH